MNYQTESLIEMLVDFTLDLRLYIESKPDGLHKDKLKQMLYEAETLKESAKGLVFSFTEKKRQHETD